MSLWVAGALLASISGVAESSIDAVAAVWFISRIMYVIHRCRLYEDLKKVICRTVLRFDILCHQTPAPGASLGAYV